MKRNSILVPFIPLLVLIGVIILYFAIYIATSFSHQAVIRRILFENGHPIGAFTTPIQNKPDSKDKRYGDCYIIQNDKINNGTENSIPGVCMKKNKYGMYYDISIGAW